MGGWGAAGATEKASAGDRQVGSSALCSAEAAVCGGTGSARRFINQGRAEVLKGTRARREGRVHGSAPPPHNLPPKGCCLPVEGLMYLQV